MLPLSQETYRLSTVILRHVQQTKQKMHIPHLPHDMQYDIKQTEHNLLQTRASTSQTNNT